MRIDLEKEKFYLEKELKRLQEAYRKLIDSQSLTYDIIAHVEVSQSKTYQCQVSYFTKSAGWKPMYDLRIKDTQSPALLILKAKVYQTTGEDWNAIQLSVMTTDAFIDMQLPSLSPQRIYSVAEETSRFAKFKPVASPGLPDDVPKSTFTASEVPYYVDGVQVRRPATSHRQPTSIEFVFKTSYTLPTFSEGKVIDLKDYVLDASYRWFAVPKLIQRTYLLAAISSWDKYDLISAPANVFFGNSFVGSTTIDAQSTLDTMFVSLGFDYAIPISRNLLVDYSSKTFLGLKNKISRGYEITIRNNKDIPVFVTIHNQVPISTDRNLDVVIEELSQGKHISSLGLVYWNLKLEPGETKKLVLRFHVKYPRERMIKNF